MTPSMADRSHLSIGEVLSLLQDDFPDVTISKIRFLESQGLLDPERTPSGYRKFYETDIERLRWILRHQRDHFLPLKVMKDRLEEATAAGLTVPPDEPPPAAPSPSLFEDGPSAPEGEAPPATTTPETSPPPEPPPAPAAPVPPPAAEPARAPARAARPAPAMPALPPRPAANPLDAGPTGVSFTLEELAGAAGVTAADLEELTQFGLLVGHTVAGETFYDGEALVIARTASGFLRFGVEARHLRMYKVAAEREAGFMEQLLMPLLKQRNPSARQQDSKNLGELANRARAGSGDHPEADRPVFDRHGVLGRLPAEGGWSCAGIERKGRVQEGYRKVGES
jgi:DNA-binding transcriptional MerR regulator